VLVLVGRAVIGSIYDADADNAAALQAIKAINKAELYSRAALEAARTEGEQLLRERERLQRELAFVPSAKYLLAGHGPPEDYLFQVGHKLKKWVLAAADERDVQVADKDVAWPAVSGVDEIRGVLFGLELLEEAAQRLFAAHDAVRARDAEATGLRAIGQLKTDDRRLQRAPARSARAGEIDLRDHVVQERLSFQFQCDAATLMGFLEACRRPDRTLAIESLQVQQPQRAGDPLLVKGVLSGIAMKPKEEK